MVSRATPASRNHTESVENLTGEQIRARGDRSVQDAVTRTTGISFTGSPGNGGSAYAARGFVGEGSVMQLYDGVRMYSGAGTVTFPVDVWSVERIDVLRGPASVLYGEGATGAVINVIPKKPFSGEIENHVRIGYGSYDTRQQALYWVDIPAKRLHRWSPADGKEQSWQPSQKNRVSSLMPGLGRLAAGGASALAGAAATA